MFERFTETAKRTLFFARHEPGSLCGLRGLCVPRRGRL